MHQFQTTKTPLSGRRRSQQEAPAGGDVEPRGDGSQVLVGQVVVLHGCGDRVVAEAEEAGLALDVVLDLLARRAIVGLALFRLLRRLRRRLDGRCRRSSQAEVLAAGQHVDGLALLQLHQAGVVGIAPDAALAVVGQGDQDVGAAAALRVLDDRVELDGGG